MYAQIVAFVLTALVTQSTSPFVTFPGEQSIAPAPRGRLALVNFDAQDEVVAQEWGGWHTIHCIDTTKGLLVKVTVYQRHTEAGWSPSGEKFALNVSDSSADTACSIFTVTHDVDGLRVDEVEISMEMVSQAGMDLKLYGHRLIEATEWVSDDEVVIRACGYNDEKDAADQSFVFNCETGAPKKHPVVE